MSRRVARPTEPQAIRVSPKLAGGLSDYRKGMIEEEINSGSVVERGSYEGSHLKRAVAAAPPTTDDEKIKRGNWEAAHDAVSMGNARRSNTTNTNQVRSAFGAVVHSESYKRQISENIRLENIRKTAASVGMAGGGAATSAGSSVERLAPEVYSPLFTMANLNLPRDRTTVNAWLRNFFLLHPIVRNVITLHATYPISKLHIKCHDPKVRTFFEDMLEETDALTMLGDLALEFWKMGEVFPFCEFDESSGKWSRYIIQNPDYIHVKKAVLGGEPLITLRPDQVLRRLVLSNNPADVQLRQQIPPNIIHAVRTGQDIRLDNFNISHLKMLSSPYDIRGTSIIVSAFKDLMLYDKLRECKFAQADGLVNPITVVKVGGTGDGDYRATAEDLEYFRQMLEEAQYDKDFKLITHAGVEITRVGASGQVLEIAEDMNLIIKNIYTALMIPPAVIDQESSVYASASIGLEVLRQRYFNFRNMIARWLVNKVFAPISEVQGFFEYKDGKKRLIVPEIEWNQMNLYDLSDYIQNITGLVGSKQASVQTLYRSLGLNYDDEKVKMRQERIDAAIVQREEQALAMMSLSELRALDPEKPISEPAGAAQEGGAGMAMPPEAGGLAGAPPGGGGLGGGLPELAPPPAPGGAPGAGAPEVPGGAPPLGPGAGAAGGPPPPGGP